MARLLPCSRVRPSAGRSRAYRRDIRRTVCVGDDGAVVVHQQHRVRERLTIMDTLFCEADLAMLLTTAAVAAAVLLACSPPNRESILAALNELED